jgi:hypothetical protein
MARHEPAIGVVAAAGGRADIDIDGLAAEELLDRVLA